MSRGVGELADLARRFGQHAAAQLRPPRPDRSEEAAAEAWVQAHLSPPELELWRCQALVDRAHTLAVARVVDAAAATAPTTATSVAAAAAAGEANGPHGTGPSDAAPRWLVPAALLHDVGKADAPLGLVGRTTATLLELVGVRRAPGRLGRYLRYTETGAARLAALGSEPQVVAWAREHHLPASQRSGLVPPAWAHVLSAADRGVPVRAAGG